MRKIYRYLISEINKNNIEDRFLFTNNQLIEENKNYKENFIFKNLKKKETFYKIYKFLKNNLDINKKTLFIGSSWGWCEFFLMKDFDIIASDVEEHYVNYHKSNTSLNYIKLDILNLDIKNKYDQIVINNIEFLFDEEQLSKSIKNISNISNPGSKVFVIFRSRDGFIPKLIDNYLLPFETYLVYLLKKLKKKVYLTKNHLGFRRNISKFIELYKQNNFTLISIYKDMFSYDFQRLRTVQKFRLSYLLSIITFKSNPYLNIIVFKKK